MLRATSNRRAGAVIWLTGISGAGKTTLATRLAAVLEDAGAVQVLDGDAVREFFEGDLGYSRADRIANVKRLAFAARLLAEHGVIVIVANIAPYYEVRDFLRRQLPRYVQIFLDAPLETVTQRDPKGLYARHAAAGAVIGLDEPYDRPRRPDLTIRTDLVSVEDALAQTLALLRSKGVADV